MMATANKMSRGNLRQLLASVGSMAPDIPVPEYREFDWRACRCYSTEQLSELSAFVQPAASALAEVFEGFCHRQFDVTVEPL